MPIAIDFGTCNSVVVRWNHALDAVDVLRMDNLTRDFTYREPGREAERTASVIPSLIHYGQGDTVIIGAQVENAGLTDHAGTFRWLKLDMLNNNTRSRRVNGRLITNPEAAKELINRLLLFASGHLSGSEDEVVITVPVEAYDAYVDWLQGAVATVFSRGIQDLDEATACILGYQDAVKNQETYCIFDFGGGTLDVSIVKTDFEAAAKQKCTILGRAGEEVGGMLVDKWMLEHLTAAGKLSPDDIACIGTLMLQKVEAAKIAISSGSASEDITQYNDVTRSLISQTLTAADLKTILDQKGFYRMVAQTVDRAIEVAQDKYGLKKSRIKGVFMVGGTSLLLGVRDVLQTIFPGTQVRCDNPFEAIAAGACRYAGQDFNPTLVHDYCLKSWNRQTKSYCFVPIVPKGTQYPTEGAVCGKYINAACAGADTLTITIYEKTEMLQPESIIEVGYDGRMRVREKDVRRQTNIRALNSEDKPFLFAAPACELGETKRFVAGFGVDNQKRLTISLKDTKEGSRSYIKTRTGGKLYLPVKDFPMVRL
jgi:molecular chaperone DnaK